MRQKMKILNELPDTEMVKPRDYLTFRFWSYKYRYRLYVHMFGKLKY